MRVINLQARLSLPWAHRLGTLLGWCLRIPGTRSKQVTRRNLALCFPELDQGSRNRLEKQSLAQLGKSVMEAGAMWQWPMERLLDCVLEVSGEKEFLDAINKGKRITMLAPHLGAWEVLVHWCSRQLPTAVLYRAPRNPQLAEWVTRARSRTGSELIEANMAGVRRLLKLARTPVGIGILPDQQPKLGDGVFAPFFGVAALTMVLAPKLIARRQGPVFTGWAERLDAGAGYRLHIVDVTEQFSGSDLDANVAAMNQVVEDCVRQCPAQYQWNYKRFSAQPKGRVSPYL